MTHMKRKMFCEVYIPMARAGKSALAIGQALGLEGDDKSISQKVSQKAAIYRKELKMEAIVKAEQEGLDDKATATLVGQCVGLMPKLTVRTREKMASFSEFLRQMIEEVK